MKRNLPQTRILPRMMIGAILACAVSTTFNASAADPQTLNGWTIEAGKITTSTSKAPSKTRQVRGRFEMSAEPGSSDSRRAGACLLADLVDQGVGLASCTSDQQCNDAYNATPNPVLGSGSPGPHLYCLGKKPGDTEKRCWIRPGPDSTHCVKGQFAAGEYGVPATAAGQAMPSTVAADPLGQGKTVPWRVYACLNPDNGLPPACAVPGSAGALHSLGKIKKARP